MRSVFLFFLLLSACIATKAQTAPPTPSACFPTKGTAAMTITGNTTFVLDDLSDFTTSEPISTININVDCNKSYRVYIAGEITALPSNINTNTVIPIETFTVVATNQSGGPVVSFPLAGPSAYQVLIENVRTSGSAGRNHQLTITRNALNTFTQAPGSHTLYLHFYLCQIQ